MHKDLQDLLLLKDRDSKLQKLEAEMKSIPKQVETETSKLKAEAVKLKTLSESFKQLEVEANQVKLERRVRQETVEKLKVQLYETTKEEEIAAMKAEIQRYEGIVSDYETQELELLEEVDQKKAEVQDQDQVVKDRKVYHAEMIEELKEKARVFVERFKEAKLDRNQAAGKVASESLNLYERIYKSKGDVAVVELRGDVCSGCNMKVVPNTLAKLRAGKELTQCENCGRILFEV